MEPITPQGDKVRKAWEISEDAYTDVISRSEEYMRYVLNDPYTAEDKAEALKFRKPLLKYSIIIPYLAILIGNEQLSRRRALIKSRSTDPRMLNMVDIVQGRWNAVNDEQHVEEKIQTTFSDALISAMGGYIVRSFKMGKDGYLDFNYEVANNMRVRLDPETKSSDYALKKCRWLIKQGFERPEVLADKYNIAKEDFDGQGKQKWYDRITGFIKRFKESGYSKGTDYDEENDTYRILEMQERTNHRFVRLFTGEGVVEVPAEDYKSLKLQNPDIEYLGEVDGEVIHITTVIPALNYLVVVDEDSEVPTSNYDVFRVSSYGFTNQVTEETSLVGLLKDIQDDINKGKSQNRDYLSQVLAGARVIFGAHEKELYEKMSKQGNQTGKVYLAKNPNTKIDTLSPQQVQPEILINTQDSMMHGDKIAQLPAAMRGESERSGESGKLFEQKVDRASAAINPYYKNVSNMRKCIVEDFVDLFKYVYSENDRLIQIQKKDEKNQTVFDQVFVNLKYAGETLNDVNNASMYVELDEGEDNITAREDNFNKLMALTEVVSQVNPALVDVKTLLENAPVKGVDKWLEYIDGMMEAQSEDAQNQKMIEDEKARLENAKLAVEIDQPKQQAQG